MLLLTNTEDVFPTEGFHLGVYFLVFTRLRKTGCLPSVAVQSEREVVPLINTWENILEMVQRSPLLSTRIIASCIGVSCMQVWRTLYEEELHPYHDHRVQHLEPGDPAQHMDLCRWISAHPELLSVILFTNVFYPGRYKYFTNFAYVVPW